MQVFQQAEEDRTAGHVHHERWEVSRILQVFVDCATVRVCHRHTVKLLCLSHHDCRAPAIAQVHAGAG